MKKKRNLIKTVIAAVVCATVFSACAFFAYAYFTTRVYVYTNGNDKKQAEIGMSLNLLFDKINSDENKTQVAAGSDLNTGAVYNENADWGTAANPYIISDIRHLQNLSALQEIGYFQDLFINENYTSGTYNGGKNIPYFLVCNPDGTPVTINGTDVSFSPIGDDQYPFVGFVGGAFKEGTTTVNGQGSDTSVIYNITVQTNIDITDVGLFGTIGYLGSEPENGVGTFTGQISTVENLLLCDVKVEVDKSSFIGSLVETTGKHLFSYSKYDKVGTNTSIPHEDHHIGILAGHVEYANVNHISVYYSNDAVAALDVKQAGANYLSSTGIIGFIYNMNPDITGGSISVGSGTSSDEISINSIGGSGGGLESGNGRGYVVASELYEMYKGNNTTGELRLMDAKDSSGKALVSRYERKRILPFLPNQTTNYYYFYDGVFTFALSSANSGNTLNKDKFEATWKDRNGVIQSSADVFEIGENKDSAWKKNTTQGNNSVVAYVKDIKNQNELDEAIGSGKQIYIGYEAGNGSISVMSLAEDYSTNNAINQNDNYTTKAFTKPEIVDAIEIDGIHETLVFAYTNGTETVSGLLPRDKEGNINVDVINNTSQYRLINLGSGDDLNTIKNNYPISATHQSGNIYSFKGDGINKCSLALLAVRGYLTGYKYSIFTGTKKAEYWGGSTEWQTSSTVIFNDDGTARIRFDYTSQNAYRYVQYNNNSFKGTTNQNATGVKLHFYTVEGTSNLNFGRITYDPADNTTKEAYSSDQVLFWPMKTYAGGAGRTDEYPAYSLKSLQGSLTNQEVQAINDFEKKYLLGSRGWKNRSGENLQFADLHMKFAMEKSAKWGLTLTTPRGNYSIGEGTIVAPVGTLGTEANIPLGTIAFRVNKKASIDNPNKIRVIVAVPRSYYYDGEDEAGSFYQGGLHYFGLWHTEANGESVVNGFNVNNAIEKFELPRSNPYDPSSTAGNSQYVLIDKDCDGTIDSRCYLNGDMVLVAYEFDITEEGVYLLGATNGPIEIVYFSADATASAGRDGSAGSMLGTIDFVYDYAGNIVTVKDNTPDNITTDNKTGENYNYYYSTLCLMYTDNGGATPFPKIDDFRVYVKRKVNGSSPDEETGLNVKVDSGTGVAGYIKIDPYSPESDLITRAANGTR